MYNKAIIIGRLTRDPELKQTTTGIPTTSFSVAVDRPMAKDKVDFLRVVAWRQSAEFVCRYFSKGRPIGVEGQIQTRKYTAKDGSEREIVEIVADRCFFVGSKAEANSLVPAPKQTEDEEFDGDLPF